MGDQLGQATQAMDQNGAANFASASSRGAAPTVLNPASNSWVPPYAAAPGFAPYVTQRGYDDGAVPAPNMAHQPYFQYAAAPYAYGQSNENFTAVSHVSAKDPVVQDSAALQYSLLQKAGIQLPMFSQNQFAVQDSQTDIGNQNGRGGLPASATQPVLSGRSSYQSSQSFVSPEVTPQRQVTDQGNGYLFSPEGSKSGNLTEPRNYAPRTAGLPAANEPPPKFDLGVAQYSSPPQAQHGGMQDPFSPIPGNAGQMRAGPEPSAMTPYGATGSAVSELQAQRSNMLNMLTNTPSGLPTFAMAMDPANFPFVEGARQAYAINHGVVKIRNIPFSSKRSEVIAFVGRNAKILNDADEGVHIIMDRVTSKTMDAYVEFISLEEAMKMVERHHQTVAGGKLNRLGDRPVEVELASQSSLMKDLFPIAIGIFWNGASPEFKPYNHAEPWENFKGFVSEEEMTMLVKHVEVPQRSPFSKDCPQRPYECLISTIKKFPWYLTDKITMSQRRAMYKAICECLRILAIRMYEVRDPINLNNQLYRRLIACAMSCPGFTPLMKDNIAWQVGMAEMEQRAFGQPRSAHLWRHQYALAPKNGIPLDVLEWYIAIIREQTGRDTMARPLKERTNVVEKSKHTDMYWGYFWAELGYAMGPQFDNMSLAAAAHAEFSAVEQILARALRYN